MPANRSARHFIGLVFLSALSSCSLFGCGGGNGSVGQTPTRAVVTSTPANIEEVGGTATYTLDINQATKVDPSSVVINVRRGLTPLSSPTSSAYQTALAALIQSKDNSLTGGPQVMTPVAGVTNRFVYQLTFPAAASAAPGYIAYYTARDTQGSLISIAVTNGTNENHSLAGTVTPFSP